jgi:hypothetical protein
MSAFTYYDAVLLDSVITKIKNMRLNRNWRQPKAAIQQKGCSDFSAQPFASPPRKEPFWDVPKIGRKLYAAIAVVSGQP